MSESSKRSKKLLRISKGIKKQIKSKKSVRSRSSTTTPTPEDQVIVSMDNGALLDVDYSSFFNASTPSSLSSGYDSSLQPISPASDDANSADNSVDNSFYLSMSNLKWGEDEDAAPPLPPPPSLSLLPSCGYDAAIHFDPALPGASRPPASPHAGSKGVHPTIGMGRDWNAAFQDLSSRRTLDDSEQRLQWIGALRKLHEEFAAVSLKVGRRIIQELHLPLAEKTILPSSAIFASGGQEAPDPKAPGSQLGLAGGLKYVYEPEGLFFKFSVDSNGIYGGDEYSMKAAGHELRSVMEFIDCCVEGIHYPSMVLIDYRGYRLMAMPILPIHPSGFENSTLIYGSADAGMTIHNADRDFSLRLKLCCQMLNLKPHRVFPKILLQTHPALVQPFLAQDHPSDLEDSSEPEDASQEDEEEGEDEEADDGEEDEDENEDEDEEEEEEEEAFPEIQRRPSRSFSFAAEDPLGITGHVMSGPVDIEGHRGTDGRYYLLDTHRTFPPTTPSPNTQGCYLYQLFRPEFVKNYRIPLCSDAFASWIMDERKEHEAEIRKATKYLLTCIVPSTALLIETNFAIPQQDSAIPSSALPASATATATASSSPASAPSATSDPPSDSFDSLHVRFLHPAQLPLIVHSRGVNIRYLGYLRSHMTSSGHRMILMTEIVARTMKNILRGRLRAVASSLEVAFATTVVNTLNQVLGGSADSQQFWMEPLRLKGSVLKRFPMAVNQCELDASFDARKIVSLPLLLSRLQSLLAIDMTPIPADHLGNAEYPHPIQLQDILQISPICKTLHRLAYEEGVAFSHAGLKEHSEGADVLQSNQHFEEAARKYGEALLIKPNAIRILHNWALSLTYQAATKQAPESLQMLSVAAQKLTSCLSFDPQDGYGLFLWGNVLIDIAKIISDNPPGTTADSLLLKLEQSLLGPSYPGELLQMPLLWQLLWSHASPSSSFSSSSSSLSSSPSSSPSSSSSSSSSSSFQIPPLRQTLLLAPSLEGVRISPCYWNLFACVKYQLAAQCKNVPPRYHRLLFNWGNALVALGQNDYIPSDLKKEFIQRSIEKYEEANKLKATVPNLRNWAVALSRLARIESSDDLVEKAFDRSQQVFLECINLRPDDPISYFNWGNMGFRQAIFYRNRSKLPQAHASFAASIARYEKSLDLANFERAAFTNWGIAISEILKIRPKLDPLPPLAAALQLVGSFLAFYEKLLHNQTSFLSSSPIASLLETQEPDVKAFIITALSGLISRVPVDNPLRPFLVQVLEADHAPSDSSLSLRDFHAIKQTVADSDQSEYLVRHRQTKREYRLKRFRISSWNRSLRLQHTEPASPSSGPFTPNFDLTSPLSGGNSSLNAFLALITPCFGSIIAHHWEVSKEYVILLEPFAEKDLFFQLSLMPAAKREECCIYYILELCLIVHQLHEEGVYVGFLDPQGVVLSSKGHACIVRIHLTRSITKISGYIKKYDPSIPLPPELVGMDCFYSLKADIWYLGVFFHMMLRGTSKPSTDLSQLTPTAAQFLTPFFYPNPADRPSLSDIISSSFFSRFETKFDLSTFRRFTQPPLSSLAHQTVSEDQTFGTIISNRSEGSFHGNTFIVPR